MKKIIFLSILCLFFFSCKNDPLDITPDGRMSLEDIFANEIQTEAYLNTIYSSVPTYFNTYQQFSFLAGATDEAQDAEVGNYAENMPSGWVTGSLTPSNNPLAKAQPGWGSGQDHYATFWTGIRDANVFLSYIDAVPFKDVNKKNRLIGEVKLLRAFFYFELVKQFGPMPVVTEPFGPAFDYAKLTRPEFQECIDFIVSECDQVIANPDVPIRITLEAERGRFSKAVAYMVKSESTLYNASPLWNPTNDQTKWEAAASAAREGIVALNATGEYRLASDYSEYFLSASDLVASPKDRETIFEIKQPGIQLTTTGLPSKEGSWMLGSTPSQELVDSYGMQSTGEPAILGYRDEDHLQPIVNEASGYDEQNPYVGRDPRFYATVWYNGASYDNVNGRIHTVETFVGGADQLLKSPPSRINTHTGYYLRKFIDPKLEVFMVTPSRFKKYRLAELFLNFAEAENEVKGPTTDIYNSIYAIRARAGMPGLPEGLSQDEMRERIRNERRVELVWEEHRFWDVRRWKILHETDKLVTGMEIRKTESGFSYSRFVTERRNAWQEKFLIFPIPITDASIIPDFQLNQNPGW